MKYLQKSVKTLVIAWRPRNSVRPVRPRNSAAGGHVFALFLIKYFQKQMKTQLFCGFRLIWWKICENLSWAVSDVCFVFPNWNSVTHQSENALGCLRPNLLWVTAEQFPLNSNQNLIRNLLESGLGCPKAVSFKFQLKCN